MLVCMCVWWVQVLQPAPTAQQTYQQLKALWFIACGKAAATQCTLWQCILCAADLAVCYDNLAYLHLFAYYSFYQKAVFQILTIFSRLNSEAHPNSLPRSLAAISHAQHQGRGQTPPLCRYLHQNSTTSLWNQVHYPARIQG